MTEEIKQRLVEYWHLSENAIIVFPCFARYWQIVQKHKLFEVG